MTTKVTAQGLLLPRELLGGVDEVEIRKDHNLIIIIPTPAKDLIFELGQQPVVADVEDASLQHDAYLHTYSHPLKRPFAAASIG